VSTRSVSRRTLITLTAGSGAAAILAACGGGGEGGTQSDDREADALNYLLTLEHLADALYAKVGESGIFEGAERKMLDEFGQQEQRHGEALAKAIEGHGVKPTPRRRASFSLEGRASALRLLGSFERTMAAVYLGQVDRFENRQTLNTVLAIHSVEGRHSAAIDIARGKSFSLEGAFAKPAAADRSLESLDRFTAGA
jgi:Ferritin-like domain